MTEKVLIESPAFPVTWRHPSDANWLWVQDQMHYPDPITPLEFSLIEGGVDAGLTKSARHYDVPMAIHDRHINGYLYTAVEPVPMAEGRGHPHEEPSPALKDALSNLRMYWEREWLPEIQEHLAWWAAFDRSAADVPALLEHLKQTEQRWARVWEIHFLLFIPSKLAVSAFADLYLELFEESDAFEPYRLLAGFTTKTMESGQELWCLSRRILAVPEVRDIFRGRAVSEVLSYLNECAPGRLFLKELETYLEDHGKRADKLSLHYPFWVEDPSPVVGNLQNYIEEPDRDLQAEIQQTARIRDEHVEQLRLTLQGYPRAVRDEMEYRLQSAQAGAFLGEEHGYWIDYQASYCVRQVLLAIGERLKAEGVLADSDDIFYLHMNEISMLLAKKDRGAFFDAEYVSCVAARRANEARFAGVPPPATLGGGAEGGPAPVPQDPITRMFLKVEGEPLGDMSTVAVLTGIGGSPGVVQGTVKVVHVLGDASKVRPGDILVANTTAPPWTPLFASIGGLVTNSGGILSHSAVVAREYGIPAVVGASMATERLQDGQQVEVDGTCGTVRVLE